MAKLIFDKELWYEDLRGISADEDKRKFWHTLYVDPGSWVNESDGAEVVYDAEMDDYQIFVKRDIPYACCKEWCKEVDE